MTGRNTNHYTIAEVSLHPTHRLVHLRCRHRAASVCSGAWPRSIPAAPLPDGTAHRKVHRAIHTRYSTQSSGNWPNRLGRTQWPTCTCFRTSIDQTIGQQLIGQRPEPAWEHFLSQRMRQNSCVPTSVCFANALTALDHEPQPTTTNFMGGLPPMHRPSCARAHAHACVIALRARASSPLTE